jgi:ectoine hydroxylase-related dioxygenase (phytanoyl-CoA dioxygenase family)
MTTTEPVILADLSEPVTPGPLDWNDVGVAIHKGMIPDELIEPYKNEWGEANGFQGLDVVEGDAVVLDADRPGGWPDCTPYMRHQALMRLCCDPHLADALADLMGEPAGVHLNLSGWVTTERNWHQDGYLNEPEVGDYYAAVWIALGNIHPDSGPFQYIPGSHLWHRLTRDKIRPHVDMSDPAWPKHTEDFLTPLVEAELELRPFSHVVSHLPQKGDVLIWHPRLYHRGSKAHVPGAYRPALIAHYSGIHHRPMMPPPIQHSAGGWFFPIPDSGPSS